MSDPLRVLAISASAIMSGAERVLHDYAQTGPHRTERWTVAVAPGPFRDSLLAADVATIDFPELQSGSGSPVARLVHRVRATAEAARAIRRASAEADVVVVNSVQALPALWLSRSVVPSVWLVHDVITRRSLRRLVRTAGRNLTMAAAVSDAAAVFPRSTGVTTIVVPNGTRWPAEPGSPTADGEPPIVGISGALTPWKGHRVFIEAASLVSHPARFQILGGPPFPGDRPYEAELHERARTSPAADRICFLGHQADPGAVMRAWSVAVSASVQPEAGPLVVLEAMALGIPVIVTDHGGGPELAGSTGLVVEPNDAAALAEAIDTFLADEALRRTSGARGRDRVADRYTLEEARAQFGNALLAATTGGGS